MSKNKITGKTFNIPTPLDTIDLLEGVEPHLYTATLEDAEAWENDDEPGEFVFSIVGLYATDKIVSNIEEEYEKLLLENQ